MWRSNTYQWRTACWWVNPRNEGSAELMSWLQHDRKSRVFYVSGAPLPVDVRRSVVSEGAVIDSLHQAQASGALQAGANTRDHVRLIGFPKEIPPRSLASGLSLQRTTNRL